MDLKVVGRHALFFDDDAMAAFVNSSDALVDWNSLQIDRYDVRHLLSAPLPPRRRRNPLTSSQLPDFAFESELDHERYLDLPLPSDEPEGEEAEKPGDDSCYHAVAFSYGNTDHIAGPKNAGGELECSQFCPPFAVPESLLQSLPPTGKVHQIIAKTATFVSKHGGQSEIVLRVKHGDNPTFGFLMPDHHLHPYFRFLVDHQELIQSDIDRKNEPEDQMGSSTNSAVGGALSLLGSVYGSGEDEDSAMEGDHDVVNIPSQKTINTSSKRDSHGLEKSGFSSNDTEIGKGDARAKLPSASNKERAPVLKKNPSMAASKCGVMGSKKRMDDSGSSSYNLAKSKEPVILEPPSDLKRLIDKIVEFIIKNGQQFESTLREQDSEHGKFPFLLPSNQYHPYYLKVLQRAEESKLGGRNLFHGGEDLVGLNMDKRSLLSKGDDALFLGSELPFESDRKEKFKMVIGKAKKDMQDPSSKASQQEYGISVDAAAAAAILQAATRGIRNPDLGIISSVATNGSSHDHGSLVWRGLNFRSQTSSHLNEMIQMSHQDGGHTSLPAAQTIKAAVAETAGEGDSPEAHMTREQKLKAERLKRAKMFVAKLKCGAGPSSTESLAEPLESYTVGAGAEVNCVGKAEEGSSGLVDSCIGDESENTERKHFGDERRSKRKYRLRSERHDTDDENDSEEDKQENHTRKRHRSHESSRQGNVRIEKDAGEGAKKHSKRKHRSHYSSNEEEYNNEDRKEKSHKHSRKKRRSRHHYHEHEDEDEDGEMSYHKHTSKKHPSHRSSHGVDNKGDHEDEKYHKFSRKKHRSCRDSDKHRKESHRTRSKQESSSDIDHMHSHKHRKETHRRSKHKSFSDTDHEDNTNVKHMGKEDLEEGEISSKVSDWSRGIETGVCSRETSLDNVSACQRASSQPTETAEVSDDLRAKIRAMLMATR